MQIVIPDFPPLPEYPVVGARYPRPCIRAHWLPGSVSWLPILGTVHNDREHVGADFSHAHVDYRFLNHGIRQSLERDLREPSNRLRAHHVFAVTLSHVWPHEATEPLSLDNPDLATVPTADWLRINPRIYQGPYPPYPHHIAPWDQALSNAFTGIRLTADKICPHQKVDLSGIMPDQNDIITCPLHGLRWYAKTGEIVLTPRRQPDRASEDQNHADQRRPE